MAYFDSPKNRAIWEKELADLRKERERREAGGFRPENRADGRRQEAHLVNREREGVRRISFKELELRETASLKGRGLAVPGKEAAIHREPVKKEMGRSMK